MNTGGPALERTLLDEFAGQALAGLYGAANDQSYKLRLDGNEPIKRSDVARDCYAMASAMLAEKARREATDKDSLTVPDHSPDATKMIELQAANRELVEALEAMVAHHTPCHWVDSSGDQYRHLNQARTALSKHKGAA